MNTSPFTENTDPQQVVNQVVLEYLREQKRQRRTRLFKRVLWGALILFAGYQLLSAHHQHQQDKSSAHVGLIDLNGEIAAGAEVDADEFAKSMKTAYQSQGLQAIVLRINSPGGSPVQADYMYSTIQHYQKKHPKIKVYAVCMDLCASAAYYVASAADKIYANPASMVGSIGVVFNGFGFVNGMEKVGVSRRLYTAGKHKGFLDPFSKENPEDIQALQKMLNAVHQLFIERVKTGRGDRLHANNDTFSGLIWTGADAKSQGLIDGFASPGQLIRIKLHAKKVINYTSRANVFDRMVKNMGAEFKKSLSTGVQNTALLRTVAEGEFH
ncbi:MAG: S49 family peptidase [Legionellaceae bacterium]|nr:S49 family peptidase [Legionellaceae bacterium]